MFVPVPKHCWTISAQLAGRACPTAPRHPTRRPLHRNRLLIRPHRPRPTCRSTRPLRLCWLETELTGAPRTTRLRLPGSPVGGGPSHAQALLSSRMAQAFPSPLKTNHQSARRSPIRDQRRRDRAESTRPAHTDMPHSQPDTCPSNATAAFITWPLPPRYRRRSCSEWGGGCLQP